MKKIISKVISIFLTLAFLTMPVSAEVFDYSKYDFSDEAQRQFDNQNLYNVNSNQDYLKIKNNNQQVTLPAIPPYNEEDIQSLQNNIINSTSSENPYLQEKQLKGSVVYVPSGTIFEILLESGISSGSLDENDRLVSVLPSDFVYNGKIIAPAGSMVYGTVTNSKSAGYAYGTGNMEILFNQILPPSGNPIQISTEKIVIKLKSSRAKNISKDVLVGVGIGLVGGVLTYLLTGAQSSESLVRAVAIGGGIGAASGGLRGVSTRGEDVKIPDGTKIKLKLIAPVNVSPYY